MKELSNKDLWKQAKARATFKVHLIVYILVNLFLWASWVFGNSGRMNFHTWPLFATLGWGVGLAFHAFNAYFRFGNNLAEREYEKLKSKKKKKK